VESESEAVPSALEEEHDIETEHFRHMPEVRGEMLEVRREMTEFRGEMLGKIGKI
jgi:hypothetical protein